jgi:hypothetical protein
VNQAGDYYVQCPYTAHPLLSWSPIIALGGIVVSSSGMKWGSYTKASRLKALTWGLEFLVGIEGMYIAFISLSGQAVFESYVGLLGYPLGFFFVLDSLRRQRAGRAAMVIATITILIVSAIFLFFALMFAVMMSEYP